MSNEKDEIKSSHPDILRSLNDSTLADALAAVERMTFEDGVTWNLREHSAIRTHFYGDSEPCCPLTAWCRAVRRVHLPIGKYKIAAELLGIDQATAHYIVTAADTPSLYRPTLRKALLEKLGLGEPE